MGVTCRPEAGVSVVVEVGTVDWGVLLDSAEFDEASVFTPASRGVEEAPAVLFFSFNADGFPPLVSVACAGGISSLFGHVCRNT